MIMRINFLVASCLHFYPEIIRHIVICFVCFKEIRISTKNNRIGVTNWFDGELDESCWSVKDNMAAAMADPKAGPILKQIREKAAASRGDVAAAVKDNPALVAMMERAMRRMTIESMLMQAGASEEDIKQLNRVLQGIAKE